MLGHVDMPILDIIVQYCATSPMARHNGIAVCSRWANVAWRKMHLRITRAGLRDATRGIASVIRAVGPTIAGVRFELDFYVGVLDDLEDIM